MKYEEEITDIVDIFYNKEKILNAKGLAEIYNILCREYELEEYVKYILFPNSRNNERGINAEYDNISKIIFFYKNNINSLIRYLLHKGKKNIKVTRMFINYLLITMLIHELNHVKQLRYLVTSTNYDAKYEILRHCFIIDFVENVWNLDYLQKYYGMDIKDYYGDSYEMYYDQVMSSNKKYNRLYEYDPSEIQAEFLAREETVNIAKYFKSDISDLLFDILDLAKKRFLIGNYEIKKNKIISPIEIYSKTFNKVVTMDKIKKEEIYTSLDFYDRIQLGLPISRDEYDKILKL